MKNLSYAQKYVIDVLKAGGRLEKSGSGRIYIYKTSGSKQIAIQSTLTALQQKNILSEDLKLLNNETDI